MTNKADYKLLRRIAGNMAFEVRIISILERIRDYEIGIVATNCHRHLTDREILNIYNRGVSKMLAASDPFSFNYYYRPSGLGAKAHTTIEKYFEKKAFHLRKKVSGELKMTAHFESIIHKITKDGTTSHRVSLDEITAEERAGKELIGKADGRDIGHCVILGAKYGENFVERAKWYYISRESNEHLKELRERQPQTIRVEFYGEK